MANIWGSWREVNLCKFWWDQKTLTLSLIFPHIYIYIYIYIIFFFFWLCWVFVAAWASHCRGFSCCGARSLGTQASVVVVHRLSCSTVCGIFPDQGSNPCPCFGRWILNHWTTREVPLHVYLYSLGYSGGSVLGKVECTPHGTKGVIWAYTINISCKHHGLGTSGASSNVQLLLKPSGNFTRIWVMEPNYYLWLSFPPTQEGLKSN